MRKLTRPALPTRVSQYLAKKQDEVNDGADVAGVWEAARRTKSLARVVEVLCSMVGDRERCMYCEDSRGSTVEHFWPKGLYPARAFLWTNMLLLCMPCNTRKGTDFPLDESGAPLLLDPTMDDPWDHLFFEPQTGLLAARYDTQRQAADSRGQCTVDPRRSTLNDEAVAAGRRQVARRLTRIVAKGLADLVAGNPSSEVEAQMLEELQDCDDFGLREWFFARDGAEESPFSDLRGAYRATWDQIRLVLTTTEPELWSSANSRNKRTWW
ncbi:MAG: hypothetical protein AB1716_18420 [Planctomycetota bacterium]